MDKISVIIPVYKVEKYLRQCVDSVLAQSYTNLEVILVDDGSPDRCGAICDEYAEKDSRVKVIHQENRGLGEARNAEMEICTGEYIAFVDSDDIVNRHYIFYMKRAVDEHNADIAYCGIRRFREDEPATVEVSCFKDQEVDVFSGQYALENLFSIWFQPNAWNKLVKRSLMMNFRYPRVVRAEDLPVSYRLLTMADKVVGLKKCPLYNYRFTPGSILSRVNGKAIEAELDTRLDVFLQIFWGRYETTAIKFSQQTRRMYLDFALSVRGSRDRDCFRVLKRYGRLLCRQMWLPTAKDLGEKLDYSVLFLSVRAWTLLQLVKYKLFNTPLYVE